MQRKARCPLLSDFRRNAVGLLLKANFFSFRAIQLLKESPRSPCKCLGMNAYLEDKTAEEDRSVCTKVSRHSGA